MRSTMPVDHLTRVAVFAVVSAVAFKVLQIRPLVLSIMDNLLTTMRKNIDQNSSLTTISLAGRYMSSEISESPLSTPLEARVRQLIMLEEVKVRPQRQREDEIDRLLLSLPIVHLCRSPAERALFDRLLQRRHQVRLDPNENQSAVRAIHPTVITTTTATITGERRPG
jgi:hypothetical protein